MVWAITEKSSFPTRNCTKQRTTELHGLPTAFLGSNQGICSEWHQSTSLSRAGLDDFAAPGIEVWSGNTTFVHIDLLCTPIVRLKFIKQSGDCIVTFRCRTRDWHPEQ